MCFEVLFILFCFQKGEYVFVFCHAFFLCVCDEEPGYFSYIVWIMAVDDLAMHGVRASAEIVLTL